jgi:integrase/recombinase XerD
MAYQYVREPLTQDDADALGNECNTAQEKLIIWPMLDCGLRVSEVCSLTPKHIQWQQRCLRIKGKGGPYGKKSKARVVPMSSRVRAIFEPYFALNDEFPVGVRRAQKVVKEVANRAKISAPVTPHVLRHTFATLFLQKGGSLAALKKILGHDRLTTTEIYLNLTDRHVIEEYEGKW